MSTYTPKAGMRPARGTSSTPLTWCSAGLPAQAAKLLRGKHKPTFAPHIDGGDFVIIINADKVAISGNKRDDKLPTATRVTPAA